jgi:tRNA threonylcarbamoyladenosine biosynthesis protein TsaE
VIVATTKAPEDTREIGAQVATLAQPGDVLVLAGDLGAGKTTFTQGFGRGLDIAERITSPTFTLVRSYDGSRLQLHHIDLYRLDDPIEVLDLGLPELIDEDAVLLIEWGDRAVPILGPDFLELRFEFGEDDDERRLNFTAVGASWSARAPRLSAAIGRWV